MELPWSDEQARWTVRRAATLARLGAEPVGPFVHPDARFFPDRFDRSPDSVGKLFERMKEHVGLADTETEVLLVDPDDGNVVSSCSSGGCGTSAVKTLAGDRVSAHADGSFSLRVATSEITHPTVLTTIFSRALGQIFLLEVDGLKRFAKDERAAAGDLAATLMGLGILVANGSAIQVKGCGGIKVHSATSLGAPQAVLGLALACERERLRGPSGEARVGTAQALERSLDPVPKVILGLARDLFRENADIVRRIDAGDSMSEGLERGEFSLRAPGSSIGGKLKKLFGFKKTVDVDPIEALEREAALSQATASEKRLPSRQKDARLDEIRALVDESFDAR